LWIVLRKDQYKIEDDKIVLKGLGIIGKIELRYEGLVHLKGEQAGWRYTMIQTGRDGMLIYRLR